MIIREPYAAGGMLFPLLVRRFERLDDASPWAAAEGRTPASAIFAIVSAFAVRVGAVRMGDDRDEYFRRNPLLTNLRAHPRFQQILDAVADRRQQRAGR